MAKSYGYTPPNSTSGWRDEELQFLYHTGIIQLCLQNHIYELLASSTHLHPPTFGVNSNFVAYSATDRCQYFVALLPPFGVNSHSVAVITTGYPVAIATAIEYICRMSF